MSCIERCSHNKSASGTRAITVRGFFRMLIALLAFQVSAQAPPAPAAATSFRGSLLEDDLDLDTPRQSGGCIKTIVGEIVCPRYQGGGISTDIIGQIVCGPGQCVKDIIGTAMCSRRPGGYVGKDIIGQPVCQGGCIAAASKYCEVLRP